MIPNTVAVVLRATHIPYLTNYKMDHALCLYQVEVEQAISEFRRENSK